MDAKTHNFNEALLRLSMLIAQYFPPHRKLEIANKFRAVTRALRHHGLNLQAGTIVGDPRDFLKLALDECAARGVCTSDIANIVNEHQRGHAGPINQGPVAKAMGGDA